MGAYRGYSVIHFPPCVDRQLGVSVLAIVLLVEPTIENTSVLGFCRSDIYNLLFIFLWK